ncbi:MAG: PIN domain-containing protein [Candidatus Eisenbacteria bacterium]|nr:PIN domain-containing protein [Candidatus Eisenbacteria bacterium]
MKFLFDADVILDLLLDRRPHALPAAELLSRVERSEIAGCLCATAVTNIHYLAQKAVGATKARQHVRMLLSLLEVAPVGRPVLEDALTLGFRDFEDAVTHESARLAGADGIVTRNGRDYLRATIPVHSPADAIALLNSASGRN